MIRPYQINDEHDILALFSIVFDSKRTLEYWYWQFRDNPAGKHLIRLARNEQGALLGQYAGVPVRMLCRGRVMTGAQIVDIMMAKPSVRKHSLRVRLKDIANHFFDDICIRGNTPFIFGCPSQAHMGVGKKQLNYVPLFKIREFTKTFSVRESLTAKFKIERRQPYALEKIKRFDADVDALWQSCKDDYPVTVIRDKTYLNWRYSDCPGKVYDLWKITCREDKKLAGVAVTSKQWQAAHLVDIVVKADDEAVFRFIIKSFQRYYLWKGLNKFCVYIPPEHLFGRVLEKEFGYIKKDTPFTLTGLSFSPELDLNWLKHNFFFMKGDVDIF